MVNAKSRQGIPKSDQGTLFGQPIAEPLCQLIGRYPFPARLNEHHVRRFRASNKAAKFDKGAILFRQGELPHRVCIVLTGRVKKYITSAQGKTLVVGFYDPGSVLGLEASILGRAYVVTAETVQATEALLVPRRELIEEMRTNAMAACQVAQLLAENSSYLMGKLGSMELSESAPQAMARCLLGCGANRDGQDASPELSHETLAQMVGLSRETVSRQLAHFRKAGVLRWNRSNFVILDREALEKLADLPHVAA